MASRGAQAVALKPLDLLETRDGIPSNKDSRMTNVLLEAHGTEAAFIKRPGYAQALASLGTPYGATSIVDANGNSKVISVNGSNLNTIVSGVSSTWTLLSTNLSLGGTNINALGPIIIYNNTVYVFKLGLTATSIYATTNGITYSLVTNSAFSGVSTLGSGAFYVFRGYVYAQVSSNGKVYRTTDLVTWTDLGAGTNATFPSFVVGNTAYSVPSNGAPIYTTTDGYNWTSGATVTGLTTQGQPVVIGSTMYFVDTSTPAVYSSTNGATWTTLTAPTFSARSSAGVTIYNDAIVVGGGTSSTDLWTSTDGASWTRSFTNTTPSGILSGSLVNPVTSPSSMGGFGSRLLSFRGFLYLFGAGSGTNNVYYSRPSSGSTVSLIASSSTAIPAFSVANPSTRPFDPLDFSQTNDKTKIAMKNTVGAWNLTVSTGTVVQVTDSDYPATTVRGLAYLDGTFYVMDKNGVIYGSDVNDFTSWNPLNRLTAQSEPDGGTCLIKYNQYVAAFGNYTVQFFYDNGNPTGSPLSPVQNGDLLVGCPNGDTVAQLEKTVFFVSQRKVQGQATGKGFSVSMLKGFDSQEISTPDVERVLNADGLFGAWGTTCNFMTHDCYLLVLPTTGQSMIYDTFSKQWSFVTIQIAIPAVSVTALTSATAVPGMTVATASATASHQFSDGDPVTIAGATPSGYNGTFNISVANQAGFTYPVASGLTTPATGTITATGYSATYLPLQMAFEFLNNQIFQGVDGALYAISDTIYTDNANYIDSKIRTSRMARGLKNEENQQSKFYAWADLVTDRTSDTAMLRFTDDDYQTYSSYRSVSLAGKRSRINALGRSIRRAWEIRHTGTNTAGFRMQYMELGIEQGDE